MQNRFKSAPLWIATIANIALIIGLFMPQLDVQPYVKASGIVITMLVQFGILNNPTNKEGF